MFQRTHRALGTPERKWLYPGIPGSLKSSVKAWLKQGNHTAQVCKMQWVWDNPAPAGLLPTNIPSSALVHKSPAT